MQLYRGLPIITNKITQDETKGVPHHLLGCISLEEETWTVGKFVGEALRTVWLMIIQFCIRTDVPRSTKSEVEASYRFWLVGLTITRNHFCSRMR